MSYILTVLTIMSCILTEHYIHYLAPAMQSLHVAISSTLSKVAKTLPYFHITIIIVVIIIIINITDISVDIIIVLPKSSEIWCL